MDINSKINFNSSFIKQKLTLVEIKLDDVFNNFLEEMKKTSSMFENSKIMEEIYNKYQKEIGDINKEIFEILKVAQIKEDEKRISELTDKIKNLN